MKRKDIYTLGTLFVITIITAVFSNLESIKYVAFFILLLSGIKFLFVAFQFMELRKAHSIWKGLLIGLLVIFIGSISIILS